MQLKEIASLNGKSGLYRVMAPTRSGLILESMDEARTKLVTPATARISVLDEISIYTTTAEGTAPLRDVLIAVKAKFGDDPGISPDAAPEELAAFMRAVLPEYDSSRVYNSDIRKLIRWYGILVRFAPDVLNAETAD